MGSCISCSFGGTMVMFVEVMMILALRCGSMMAYYEMSVFHLQSLEVIGNGFDDSII